MTMSSLLAPVPGAAAAEPRSVLLAITPAALGIAAVLLLLTAVAVLALVREVRRDGYGLERPRPISREFPWQTEPRAPRRRRARAGLSWSFLSASRAAQR
jgi:hypothetical protein